MSQNDPFAPLVFFDDETVATPAGTKAEGLSFCKPLDSEMVVTSNYGFREDPMGKSGKQRHTGVDFRAAYGSPLKSMAEGIVVTDESDSVFGEYLEVASGKYVTRYAHLSKKTVRVGARVAAGQEIGNTGGKKGDGESTAPHLHIGVSVNGSWIDPTQFMDWFNDCTNLDGEHKLDVSTVPIDMKPQSGVLEEILGVSAAVVATAIVVGLLTEVVQSWAYRTSETTTMEWLRPILVKISTIPGLKHIDWGKCDIRSDNVSRRDAWTELKNADYANRKCIYGVCDQNDQKQPAGLCFVNDMDFTDVVRVVTSIGLIIYGTKVSTEMGSNYDVTPEVPLVVRGFDQFGERRYIQLPRVEAVSR